MNHPLRRRSPAVRRLSRVCGAATLAIALAAAGIATQAQPRVGQDIAAAAELFANFDIRTDKARASAAQLAWLEQVSQAVPGLAERAAAQDAAEARLKAAGLVVEHHEATDVVEIVGAAAGGGFLTAAADDRVAALRGFLTQQAGVFGLDAAQVAGLEVVADYVNPAGNMAWVELEQRFGGIPVFQGTIRGGFTAKGELARTTGVLAANIAEGALARVPSVGAAQAVALSAQNVGWNVTEAMLAEQPSATADRVTFTRASMAGEPSAWLVYFPVGNGVARLAWATQIVGDPYGFLTVVDAESGTLLFRKNLTEFQTQAASYGVYTDDSPAPSSPTPALPGANYQAPYISRQLVTLIGNEAPNTFNNLGWLPDGVNETAGNNVRAGLDRAAPDGIDATVAGSPARVFNFAYNPQTDDPLTAAYQNGEISDMFFWSNRYHDRTYLLGFTEAARNFQNDNFARGGAAGDRVNAEGQDVSGFNNANFLTPADGTSGRMQMYLFNGPTPDRTSAIDHDVLLHELTHGLSNRLHANASGLSSNMARGMGEGWSDFYARALLSDASEPVTGVFNTGGWVTNLIASGYTDNYFYGIRRFPYAIRSVTGGALNRPFNPLTFADLDVTQANIDDGAYPRGPVGAAAFDAVHNMGEVWASMLFEVRARFITRLGHAAGNQRILQIVTDGMKLDPASPTFVQARDAILAAATAGGGTAADIADIWAGFAARGLGFTASVVNAGTGNNTTRVVESFLTPTDPVPTFTVTDVTAVEGNAGTTNFTFTVSLANPLAATEHRVSFATADGSATSPTTTQTAAVATTIPGTGSQGVAAPYPVTLNVAGATGAISSLAVRVNGLSHAFPTDLDLLLVGPGGQRAMIMSDIGGGNDVSNISLTFQDGAAAPPSTLATGTYAPTDLEPGDVLPAPAPGGPYTSALSVFNGTNPNGTWSLYVIDDAAVDVGELDGFSLIMTLGGTGDYSPAGGQLVFPAGTTSRPINVAVNGDLTVESNETFTVNLSNPVVATIGDGTGLGTIVNDDGVSTVQAPLDFRLASMTGNTVRFEWTPPLVGPAPTGYVIEGGGAPGSVLASLPTGSTNPVFTFAVPTGSFYVRVHALQGATRSAASNEIRIHVNVPVAPSSPLNLLGMVNGSQVALAWKNTFEGGAPANLVLDVSGPVTTAIPLGLTDRFQFANVPGGAYTLRLRAVNGAGSSPPSNAVSLSFPGGCSGAPQAPTNLRVWRVNRTLFVTWDPPTSGTAPTGYVLNVSGDFTGSFATAGRALSGNVGPGTYNLSVVANNPCGTGPATGVTMIDVP